MSFFGKLFDDSPRETSTLRWLFLCLCCISMVNNNNINSYSLEIIIVLI